MTGSAQKSGRLRVLLGIASYGEKNLGFLKQIIQAYRSMAFDTDVVVFSEAPKNLGDGVRVLVGLPGKNPWSLPFAHKAFFAENVDHYDLFIYTEDDMDVTEGNVQAFLRAMPDLEFDEIAGFLRYETNPDGTRILTDVHGTFHWKPESVKRRGSHTIAEFTNEHAGFYILTPFQLKRAIASGGFLKAPYQGRYGLPETAATDPYTCCGFRKVIVISELDNFLIRHMSNLYVNRHGESMPAFQEQVQTLMNIREGKHPVSVLCPTEPRILQRTYYKSYYEKPCEELLRTVPEHAKSILSVGCGWGATERTLKQRGARITALPLDSVVGAAAERSGFEVVYGAMDECFTRLGERKFDCVLLTNLLHLLPDPKRALEQCCGFVGEGGTLVISGPNFHSVPVLLKRVLNREEYQKLRNADQSGINTMATCGIVRQLKRAGLGVIATQWFNRSAPRKLAAIRRCLGRYGADDWIVRAQR